MGRPDRRWTTTEWDEVLELKKTMQWHEIATIYDTSANSLRVTAYKRRKGLIKNKEDESRKLRSVLVSDAIEGFLKPKQIAAKHGIPVDRCYAILKESGLDRKKRNHYYLIRKSRENATKR
jgi:hypothetical protein